MKKIMGLFSHPLLILYYLDRLKLIKLSDKLYVKLRYRKITGKKLNLNNPQTFNEKMQWLKIYDRNPKYSIMVDKYEAKKYVSNIITGKHIIPTYGVYDKFDDINFDELPEQFVIKCTHDSGGIIICREKSNLNIKEARKNINKALKRDFYRLGREWPYKNIKRRIIVEKYIEEADSEDLIDYKFFCFNGKCKIILVCSERFSSDNMCETFFDENWNFINVIESGHRVDKNIRKPVNLDKMIEISEKLSSDIPFLRVDLYEINNQIYFGENTFFPASGFENFEPEKYNEILGNWIKINK